jgi:hypothetical protein
MNQANPGPPGTYEVVTVRCRMCDDVFSFLVRPQDIDAWRAGTYAQDAFPYLSVGHRELLISETCPDCWNALCGDEGDA